MTYRTRRALSACAVTILVSAFAMVPGVPAHAVAPNCLGRPATIKGDGADNTITGTPGNDVILAGAGADTIDGAGGNDVVCGGTGDDHIDGGIGDDLLVGEAGADHLIGNRGTDTIDYETEAAGVSVLLGVFRATAADGVDALASVENVITSTFADTIVGNDGPNRLQALAGNDVVIGELGSDVLDGGDDLDTAAFNSQSPAVDANLATGIATGQGTDSLLGIENLRGSERADNLVGNGSPNRIDGSGGNDTIHGGDGGDVIDGGSGSDSIAAENGLDRIVVTSFQGDDIDGGADTGVVDFAAFPTGVTVNLATGSANDGGTAVTIADIEDVVGTAADDTLIGDATGNRLDAGRGSDTIEGAGGNDTLIGDAGVDVLTGGAGVDTLDGGTDADQLDGGAGKDTASFAREALAPVSVNLENGSSTGQGNDVLVAIENLVGSAKGDVLVGDSKKNVIDGAGGTDSCDGNGGADNFLNCE